MASESGSEAKIPAIWIVRIPGWRPALINELLGHPQKAARIKRADRIIVGAYCRLAGVPAAVGLRRVRLTIVRPGGRRPDPDGVWKSLLDALVRSGMLVDDSERYCRCVPVEFRAGPKETIITLEDL